jgi:hypothetical protein
LDRAKRDEYKIILKNYLASWILILKFFKGFCKKVALLMLIKGNLLANVSGGYPIPSTNCPRG